MKIISKIKIHPLYYIVAFICVITGMFHAFVIVNTLIFIHEMGHVLASIYYGWKIEKILLLPFGGMTIFKESLNRPIKEEFVVASMGPIFQIVCFCFLRNFGYTEITTYHYALLCFNLLPMVPLDGSKILGCLLYSFFSFKKSGNLLILISFVTSIFLLLLSLCFRNLILLVLLLFVLKEIHKNYQLQPYLFYKFLLERYLSFLVFSKVCYINGANVNKMRKDYNHMFYVDSTFKSERQILRTFFTR